MELIATSVNTKGRFSDSPPRRWQSIISRLAKALVMHPEDVRVSMSPVNEETIYVKAIHKGDMKKLLGKGGEYVKSINTLLAVVNKRDRSDLAMMLLEPDDDLNEWYPDAVFRDHWSRAEVSQLLADIASEIFRTDFEISVLEGGEFETRIEISVKPGADSGQLVDVFNLCLGKIFKAIGFSEGRRLSLKAKIEDVHRSGVGLLSYQRW